MVRNSGFTAPPKWLWEAVVLTGFIAVVVVLFQRYGADVDAATEANQRQDKEITAIDGRVDWHDVEHQRTEAWRIRMEDKMDRMLQRWEK